MKNDHRSGKPDFVLKKTRIVTKNKHFLTFKTPLKVYRSKKNRKSEKKFPPILDLMGRWSRDHFTPHISGQGWKSNKRFGDIKQNPPRHSQLNF
jgi:hypothetical protein